ncbi:MAG TPA: hypothetical protein VFC81_01155, partial [Verrucomicrobiae bacterium]|nr:hypothetical protein [Verrucomicrobiae bacterium]
MTHDQQALVPLTGRPTDPAQAGVEVSSLAGHSNVGWLLLAILSLAGFVVLTLAVASRVVF